jgi:hypothetical protein
MSEKLVYLYNKGVSVTFIDGGKPVTVGKEHPRFDEIVACLSSGEHSKVADLIVNAAKVQSFMQGKVRVEGSNVFYGTLQIGNVVVDRIVNFIENGIDANPLLKFLDNLMKNPNRESVEQLYLFLEHGNMPITDDGCFLAYKYLQDDYLSYSCGHEVVKVNGIESMGHIDNSIGNVVEMERDEVDSDPNSACSVGLHVGAYPYVQGSSNIVIVKVNPRDVVSVPRDYSNQKMRTCKYEVVSQFEDVMSEPYRNDDPDNEYSETIEDEEEDNGWDDLGDTIEEAVSSPQTSNNNNNEDLVDDVLNILQGEDTEVEEKPELRIIFLLVSKLNEVIGITEEDYVDKAKTELETYGKNNSGPFTSNRLLVKQRTTETFFAPSEVRSLMAKIQDLNPDKKVVCAN